jgi:uncharacterized membrane protein
VKSFKDTKARSLLKGITWRIVGTIDTFLLAYLFLGEVKLAGPIALIEVATKVLLYFIHERLWNLVNWGRHDGKVSHVRSVAKGVSWRVFGTIDTIMISWIWSGNPWGALKIGFSEVLTKVVLFYLHERVWALVKWGRVFHDEVEVVAVAEP